MPLLSKGQLYEARELSDKAMPFGYRGPLDRKLQWAFRNNLDKGCSSATNKLWDLTNYHQVHNSITKWP